MTRFALALAATLTLGTTGAHAQQLGSYYAEIGFEDMRNSRGVPLGDLGAILQQDRANFHRFGIRHGGDQGDPYFASRANRGAIPSLYARGPRDALIERIILQGNPLGILVILCGSGGGLSYLVVNFADGDGYNGC